MSINKTFLNKTSIANKTKAGINKWDDIKLNSFCTEMEEIRVKETA
jgi:hypothetical protein